ncbi:MAG: hypothetical protein WC712_00825 [Candidatus Brocadiia bacterium]
MTSYTTRAGEVYTFTYDSVGNLLTKSGPLSSNWVWTYTAGNLLSTATDPNSNVTNYIYDGSNRLWKIILPDDNLVTPTHAIIYTYDLNSQVSTKTDPNGSVETYTYDAYGNYASVVNSPDGGITSYTTSYTNNAWGMPTNIVNPRGYTTMYEYDTRHYNTKVKVEYSAGVYSETIYTHNASGSVATVTDPLTNVTEFSYDSLGRRYEVEHADGNFEQWGFDENGNTIWHQDSVTFDYNIANATSFCTEQYVYDTWNRCWQTGRLRINPVGGAPAFVTNYDETRFSADGNRVYYADYLGNVTTWVYDSLNRLDYETDPYTNADDHTYDYNGNLLSYTDKNGNAWSYTYDALNRKVTEVAPLAAPNNTTTWGYDYNGNVLTVTDRLGHVTTCDFDDLNRLHSVTNDQLCCTVRYQYDANGNKTRVTDAWLYYTDCTYSRQDRVLTVTKPDTGVITYEYDRCGNVTRTVDEEGGETRTNYDVMNRVYQVTHAYGTAYAFTTTTTYDANGRTSRFEDGVGNYTDTTYDPRSLTLETDYYSPTAGSTHSTTSYGYDVQGNCTSVTDALSNTTTLYYDDMNRQYETVKPSGATYSKTFDANGNVDTETDGESNTTVYSVDSMNRCWRTTDAQSNNFDKTFDEMGNVLTEVVSPDGGTTLYTTTYVYDSLYKMTSMTDALNHAHLNWYDTAGRLTNYIDRAGNPVDFTYDSCGRVTQIDHPAPLDPLTSMQTVMTYDLCGRMLTYTSPEIDKEFTYDVLGRKIQEDQVMPSWPTATTLTATFTYDGMGRTTQISDFEPGTGNLITDYTYDDAALTKTVTENPQNGNPARVNTFQYDAAGNLTCKTVDSGMYEDYYYDTDNRMYYQEVVDSGNTVLGYQGYTFDDNSQVDSDVTTGSFGSYSTAYTYDSRRLLTAEVRTGTNSYSKGYTYDGMYCRTQKTVGGTATNYTYNDLGRITAATGGTAFTCVYDDNGNLTAKTTGLIVESYAFDWKNNLVRYQNSDTAEDMFYGYDIGSTRIIKARPEEGGGTYDVCADISGWKHFFHKTAGDRWLYAESETDGANWWWTAQYTLDNTSGVGFIENVQTARTGFPVDIYSCTVDQWGNNRVMYDSAETCVLNAEYDSFLVESNWNGGADLKGGMFGERNSESPNILSGDGGATSHIPEDAQSLTLHGTFGPNVWIQCGWIKDIGGAIGGAIGGFFGGRQTGEDIGSALEELLDGGNFLETAARYIRRFVLRLENTIIKTIYLSSRALWDSVFPRNGVLFGGYLHEYDMPDDPIMWILYEYYYYVIIQTFNVVAQVSYSTNGTDWTPGPKTTGGPFNDNGTASGYVFDSRELENGRATGVGFDQPAQSVESLNAFADACYNSNPTAAEQAMDVASAQSPGHPLQRKTTVTAFFVTEYWWVSSLRGAIRTGVDRWWVEFEMISFDLDGDRKFEANQTPTATGGTETNPNAPGYPACPADNHVPPSPRGSNAVNPGGSDNVTPNMR